MSVLLPVFGAVGEAAAELSSVRTAMSEASATASSSKARIDELQATEETRQRRFKIVKAKFEKRQQELEAELEAAHATIASLRASGVTVPPPATLDAPPTENKVRPQCLLSGRCCGPSLALLLRATVVDKRCS